MANCMTFLLRTAFLAFFALNAWNTLKDIDNYHLSLHKNYSKFEETFTERTGFKFPKVMTSDEMGKHSQNIAKGLAWAQLGLAGAALFICSCFTGFVGFIYLVVSMVQLNAANLCANIKLSDLEPFALALGLFAASLVLSCNGAKTTKKDNRAKFANINESTTSKASSDVRPKKRAQRD